MNTYRFILQRGSSNGKGETIPFPLAPEQFNTSVGNKNKTIELVNIGEVNIPKNIGLRVWNFKLLLPKDFALLTDSYVSQSQNTEAFGDYHEPVWYLNRIRDIKERQEIVYLIIIRKYIDSIDGESITYKNLFGGNVKVTIEDYKVEENAGEEGDFYVTLNLKEYREVGLVIDTVPTGKVEDGKIQVKEEVQRQDSREIPSTYTVKQGDTLWSIAKLQLGDGSEYKTIMKLNGLTSSLIVQGQILKLK